jgi:hypothetical protein
MQKFQDVLEGKLKVADLTPEEMPDFVKFAKTESEKVLGETTGVRSARQAEETKLEGVKAKLTEAEGVIKKAEELSKPALSPEMQALRSEQVEKAKERLWSSLKGVTDEQKTSILDRFKQLDSNKLDAEFIYRDLLASAAAAMPERFAELHNGQVTREQQAQEEIARQAAANGGTPPPDPAKKFSPEALQLAQQAGITPEAATKQLTQGNRRVIGE